MLRAFDAWGGRCFARLAGMFAIAIWDAQRHVLHLARDQCGIKPLYVARFNGLFVFSSEVAALARYFKPRHIGLQALSEFLFYGNPLATRSLWSQISKLPPGHVLEVSQGGSALSVRAIDEIGGASIDRSQTSGDVVTQTTSMIRNAVQSQLIGDVPLGIFLSGGVDSSAILAFAAEALGRVSTYTAGFDFAKRTEFSQAARIAQVFGADHHELFVRGEDLLGVIVDLVSWPSPDFTDT